jgi:signal transduction histidine kinase
LDERIPFISISSFFKKDERFWLFGEKGLYCYDKKKNESRTFTMEDGLSADEFTLSDLVVDQNGRYIAGTSNGLVSFFPSDVKNITNAPRAQLNAIYINDVLDTTSINPNELQSLKLSSRQNTFSFDFSSVSFFHNSECSFEYMLENYDDKWVKSGVAHYTRYSKIPPGKYSFRLRVLDNQGKISQHSKALEIEIARSFWQTNFFRAIIAVFIVLFSWLFLKWYSTEKLKKQMRELEKLKAIEKERTRIATDMHDDLGAGLSRIKFLSETIGIKKQQQQPFEEDIIKIREYSHEMIDKMGEIVWALNEKNDSLNDLISYIRGYAANYLSQNGIICKIEVPDNFPTSFVSGEFRRNVYLTIKEALHNIVKHSQASSVKITIQVNDNLAITIADNGIGLDKKNIRPFSNGLTNMQNRIKEIKGDFTILNENGTTVKIVAPLQV